MIEGNKVVLRVSKEEDIPELVQLANKLSDIGEYWPAWLLTETALRKRQHEDGAWGDDSGRMVITDKSDRIAGTINYFKSFQFVDGYELAYRIYRPEDRGKGYMGEALRLFVAYFFRIKPINRMMLRIFPGNTPSKKLAEKCGFKHEGTFRQAMFHNGQFYDLDIFAIIREDWEKLNKDA